MKRDLRVLPLDTVLQVVLKVEATIQKERTYQYHHLYKRPDYGDRVSIIKENRSSNNMIWNDAQFLNFEHTPEEMKWNPNDGWGMSIDPYHTRYEFLQPEERSRFRKGLYQKPAGGYGQHTQQRSKTQRPERNWRDERLSNRTDDDESQYSAQSSSRKRSKNRQGNDRSRYNNWNQNWNQTG